MSDSKDQKRANRLEKLAGDLVYKLGTPGERPARHPPPVTHLHLPLTDPKDKNGREMFLCQPKHADGHHGATYIVYGNKETKEERIQRLRKKLAKENDPEKRQKLFTKIRQAEEDYPDRKSHTFHDYQGETHKSRPKIRSPEWREERNARSEISVGSTSRHSVKPSGSEHRSRSVHGSQEHIPAPTSTSGSRRSAHGSIHERQGHSTVASHHSASSLRRQVHEPVYEVQEHIAAPATVSSSRRSVHGPVHGPQEHTAVPPSISSSRRSVHGPIHEGEEHYAAPASVSSSRRSVLEVRPSSLAGSRTSGSTRHRARFADDIDETQRHHHHHDESSHQAEQSYHAEGSHRPTHRAEHRHRAERSSRTERRPRIRLNPDSGSEGEYLYDSEPSTASEATEGYRV